MGKPPQSEHAGLLPRAMNTIFSSIKDNMSETKVWEFRRSDTPGLNG